MRVLLVEDDPQLGRATLQGLKSSFAADWVQSAEEADKMFAAAQYQLLLVDINLPGQSGLDWLKRLRKKGIQTPILLLTARDAIEHRVEGLNSGADDYLVKPFDLDELIARCWALVRRSGGISNPSITQDELYYEPATGIVKLNHNDVHLSQRELAILDCLMRNLGKPMSKTRIEESIYDWSSADIESNTIEVHIASLRRKIGRDRIKTMRGIGYTMPKSLAL